MYADTKKKTVPSLKTIETRLEAQRQKHITNKWGTKAEIEALKTATPEDITRAARHVQDIAKLIVKQSRTGKYLKNLFAHCEKYPANLDAGRHYYSIYYIKDGGLVLFWPGPALYSLFGQDRQDRDQSIRRFIFSSRAIGMSRRLDATDGAFRMIKNLTGTYAQIDNL